MNMRQWVYQALLAVVQEKTYSNLYLKHHLQEVDEKDQKLAVQIFYGTLQNYALCQASWSRFAHGKVKKAAGVLLTMSVYQLMFLDRVPAYAVIDEANRIAARRMPEQRGMINAILRQVEKTPFVLSDNPVEALAQKTSLPVWLISLWASQYGPQRAFQFAQSTLQAMPTLVRLNPLVQIEKLPARLAARPDGLYTYTGSQIGTDPLYRQGKMSVQDQGSYEIARWMDVRPGEKVLDVCAAPGTKSMAMAEMAQDLADIEACDLHEHRVELIENDARRLHLSSVHARKQDATLLEDNPVYDAVLCDVPCSGYGVLARKPDMKLRLKPQDIDELVPVQKEILDRAAAQVRPGGRLVYSTCTLNKKENEKQVESFLASHPDFELDKQETIDPGKDHGGFYIARLFRKKA